jgi:hypothetical protein
MRASFKSAEIVHGDWKKAIIVRGKRMRSHRLPHKGEIAMVSLMDSRTNQNLGHTFSDGGLFNRLSASGVRAAEIEGQRECPSYTRSKADHDGGHLDFLTVGYDTSSQLGSTAVHAGWLAWCLIIASRKSPVGAQPWPRPAAQMPSTT